MNFRIIWDPAALKVFYDLPHSAMIVDLEGEAVSVLRIYGRPRR